MIIGAAGCKVYVHEKLIRRSDFFDRALKGEWKENQTRSVLLPDEDLDTFKSYMHWLYTGNIPTPLGSEMSKAAPYDALTRLYGLGERLLDGEFQDRVLDTIVVEARERIGPIRRLGYPGRKAVSIIYESTPDSSPARRLMVDLYVPHGTGRFNLDADFPAQFLADVAKGLMADRRTSTATRQQKYSELEKDGPCSYHHHKKDKPCIPEKVIDSDSG